MSVTLVFADKPQAKSSDHLKSFLDSSDDALFQIYIGIFSLVDLQYYCNGLLISGSQLDVPQS